MYDAWECSDPKERIALTNKAIEIYPLCTDAYNLLAEEKAKTKKMALAYYRQGVEAGFNAIKDDFEEYRGHFWGFLETRPYMRARAGEAEMLWETGEKQAAVDNYKEMLELNPGDNQGIRYILVANYLELGQFDELKPLFEEYGDEYSADMQYTRALVAFIEGDAEADKIANQAFQTNSHVPAMLSGRKKTVPLTGYITMGGKDEATSYVRANRKSWRKAEGAIEWLEQVTRTLTPSK